MNKVDLLDKGSKGSKKKLTESKNIYKGKNTK